MTPTADAYPLCPFGSESTRPQLVSGTTAVGATPIIVDWVLTLGFPGAMMHYEPLPAEMRAAIIAAWAPSQTKSLEPEATKWPTS